MNASARARDIATAGDHPVAAAALAALALSLALQSAPRRPTG